MTVGAPPKRRPVLTDLDKEMLARLLQQSQTPIEAYTRESALGVPWGSLANSLVGGMLVGRERNRARNLQEQQDKAAVALLTQAPLYNEREPLEFRAGKYTDAQGNFIENLAPVEQGVGETRFQREGRVFREDMEEAKQRRALNDRNLARALRLQEIEDEKAGFEQFVQDQPDKIGYDIIPNVGYAGTTTGAPFVKETGYRGESLQPLPDEPAEEVVIPEEITREEITREEIMPAETVEGITIEGSKEDPSWWDRNIRGDIEKVTAKNQIELALLAGYDPLEFMNFAQKQQTKGHKILSIQEAINEGIINAEEMVGNNGFFQKNLKDGKISLVQGKEGDKIDIDVSTGTGQKYGEKAKVELFADTRKENYEILKKTNRNIQGAQNLIFQLEQGGFKTGAFAPLKQFLLSYGEELGLLTPDLKTELIGLQSFEADTNQIVLSFIKTLGRNPTDLDLRFMIKTLPSANKTQEANLYILQSRMEIDKATKELLDWERRYQYELAEGGREGGGIILETEVYEQEKFAQLRDIKKQEIAERTNLKLKEIYNKYQNVKDDDITKPAGTKIQFKRDANGILYRVQ
jgi:hypothetical protein